MTVLRSIGNGHGHLGVWCWTQRGQTWKASTEDVFVAGGGFGFFIAFHFIFFGIMLKTIQEFIGISWHLWIFINERIH